MKMEVNYEQDIYWNQKMGLNILLTENFQILVIKESANWHFSLIIPAATKYLSDHFRAVAASEARIEQSFLSKLESYKNKR